MREAAVQFEGFTFQYKAQQQPTLHDINLTIYKGEKVLILGASGSGKSTLANCINGIIPFSFPGAIKGRCLVKGHDTRELSIFQLSRSVGTVLQDSDAQFVGLSVGEDIAFAMENDNTPRPEMLPRVFEHSAQVGMSDFLAALPFNLSGGQKQKVSLAGVLGDEMGILIFDEPLASLDPETGTVAIDLIDRIARQDDRTVIIIEHRLEDVLFRPVDRVILMDSGRIVADVTPLELLRGDLLRQYGIREPLYITALKYAGCDIQALEHLDDVTALELPPADRHKLLDFFAHEGEEDCRPPGQVVVEARDVSYAYAPGAPQVVQDMSFTVRRGERLAIIGKNGAGKSTMARLICGIGRPHTGVIHLDGRDYSAMTVKEIGERVGFVMQNPNQMLVKDTIRDEVELALKLRGLPEETVKERAETALKTCELYRMRNWPVDAVSYGQKKRITVAAILALEPDVLILDEPTAGQDYRHYMEIIQFIDRLNREYGKTIIFITHDMHLAIENTDRAVVFADGRIIADDSVFAVLSDDSVIGRANLKQTSLYALARKLELEPRQVTQRYIHHERGVRHE